MYRQQHIVELLLCDERDCSLSKNEVRLGRRGVRQTETGRLQCGGGRAELWDGKLCEQVLMGENHACYRQTGRKERKRLKFRPLWEGRPWPQLPPGGKPVPTDSALLCVPMLLVPNPISQCGTDIDYTNSQQTNINMMRQDRQTETGLEQDRTEHSSTQSQWNTVDDWKGLPHAA